MDWCGILYEGRFSADKILRVIRTVFVFLVLCAVVTNVRLGSPTVDTGNSGERPETRTETAAVSDAVLNSVAEDILGVPVYIPELPEALPAESVLDTAAPVIPKTVLADEKPDVQSPSRFVPSVSAPVDSETAASELPSYVPTVPEISAPADEEVLVPDTPSEPAADSIIPSEPAADPVIPSGPAVDEPETDAPAATVPSEPAPSEPATGVINGFLVNESGVIYGVADPETVVSDGYMELPDEGCSGIAAGTFRAGLPSAREIYIPSNITYIEPGAFTGLTNMEWYEMEPSDGYYTEQGVLFSEGGTCILAFPAARTGNYKVPSQVVKFAAGAFDDAQIQAVDAAMCTLTDTSSFPGHIELITKETP